MNLQYLCSIVPVMQISLVRGAGPASHEKLGQVLAQLRSDGVLVIGSASLTHKLHEFRGQLVDAAAPHWVSEFESSMRERLEANDSAALLDQRPGGPAVSNLRVGQEISAEQNFSTHFATAWCWI